MLHSRQENHVSLANEFSTPCLRHQINALGRSTREDDFISARRANVVSDALPRVFISFSRPRAQCVQPPMDICILMLIEIAKRFDHCARLLRGGSAIEINQGMAVRLFAKNREIFTK